MNPAFLSGLMEIAAAKLPTGLRIFHKVVRQLSREAVYGYEDHQFLVSAIIQTSHKQPLSFLKDVRRGRFALAALSFEQGHSPRRIAHTPDSNTAAHQIDMGVCTDSYKVSPHQLLGGPWGVWMLKGSISLYRFYCRFTLWIY